MVGRSESPTAPQPYFYIIQSEAGESIVEYGSNSAPPNIGNILNLTNITSDHEFVEVVQVEQIPAGAQTVVRVTVKPATWSPTGQESGSQMQS